jgi:hypothetical protein
VVLAQRAKSHPKIEDHALKKGQSAHVFKSTTKQLTLALNVKKVWSRAQMVSHVSSHLARVTLSSETKSFFQEISAMDVVIANSALLHVKNKADAVNNIVTLTRLLKDFVP